MGTPQEREIAIQEEIQAHATSWWPFWGTWDGKWQCLYIENAYKINLPIEYGVSCTFNVADLKPYYKDDKLKNLRVNSFFEGEHDLPMVDQEDQPKKSPNNQDIKSISLLI